MNIFYIPKDWLHEDIREAIIIPFLNINYIEYNEIELADDKEHVIINLRIYLKNNKKFDLKKKVYKDQIYDELHIFLKETNDLNY